MAPSVEISIPTTSISPDPKPYTLYNITLRLPLRSFTVPKRYSDFLALDQTLSSQVGSRPPAPLPAKSWFTRTVSSPELTEQRRICLETYLRTINEADDGRWRHTSEWRAFLNLPSSVSSANSSSSAVGLHASLTSPAGLGAPITDPVVWIDCHRNLKTQLHDARIHLQRRDQAHTAHDLHESSAAAKRCLVLAGGMITALDQGLKALAATGANTARSDKLGDGELRRRRDLLAAARTERDGLETLANSLTAKSTGAGLSGGMSTGGAAATAQQKSALFGGANGSQHSLGGRSGRVLGAPVETEQTRELDNAGLLQLQRQEMEAQDQSLEVMTKGVMRLKELAYATNEELEIQNRLMGLLDEDINRVGTKVQVAKKRVGKIS